MQEPRKEDDKKFQLKNSVTDYFKLGAMGGYFLRLFGRKDPNAPKNFNLSMMHGINRISVILFLFALIVLIVRRLF